MTATIAVSTAPATRRATRHPYTGTAALVRLNLRRERIPLLAWVLGIGAVAASTFSTIAALYPEAAERATLALSISTNPAFLAITGPISNTSIGAISAWRVGAVGTSLVGLMAIFTVIRRTRADEEAGRTELLSSSVVGRAAPLAAAVTVAVGASLAIGVLIAAAGIGSGEDAAGAIAFGGAMAGCGLVFAGIAAIAAQLAESSRTALGIACAVLAGTYALRAIGDVQSSLQWLTWLSPQGWANHVGPFGDNNVAVLGLFLVAAVAAVLVAGWLLDRRDLGLALFPARLGPASNPAAAQPGGTGGTAAARFAAGLAGGSGRTRRRHRRGGIDQQRSADGQSPAGRSDGEDRRGRRDHRHAAVHHGSAGRPDHRRLRHLRGAADEQRGDRGPGGAGAGHAGQPAALDGRASAVRRRRAGRPARRGRCGRRRDQRRSRR